MNVIDVDLFLVIREELIRKLRIVYDPGVMEQRFVAAIPKPGE